MSLTRQFNELVKTRADQDRDFRIALLQEAIDLLIHGQTIDGKSALRTYIDATIGIAAVADALGKRPESLRRMMSADGHPKAADLFTLLAFLQDREGVMLRVSSPKTTFKTRSEAVQAARNSLQESAKDPTEAAPPASKRRSTG